MGDFLRDQAWLLWLAVALLLGLAELASFDFFFSMLVIGALAASVTASGAFDFNFAGQAIVFSVVSVLCLIILRPILKRWVLRNTPEVATNTEALVGQRAIVLSQVTDREGQVKLAGDTWSARSARPDVVFPVDADVVVVRIDGATAIVDAPRAYDEPSSSFSGDA